MKSELYSFIEYTLYFLAMINPASKIFLLATMNPQYTQKELVTVAARSTLVAFLILATLAAAGNFILQRVFHVQIYSLNIAGGVVLFLIGLNAVREGKFFEQASLKNISDASIVPLAAPLIAGPGCITAIISFASLKGTPYAVICVFAALIINLILMCTSNWIGKELDRFHAIGPLVRITGLAVAAIAAQMILDGFKIWMG